MTHNGLRACIAVSLSMLLAAPSSAQGQRDGVLDLKFADFFMQPVGPRGLAIADALRAADGRRVRLVGYMVAQEQPAVGQFMLTPRPVRLSEHADGEADDLPPATVHVMLDEGHRGAVVPHKPGLIALTGRLQVGRAEDPSGRVSWLRLHLDPESIAEGNLGDLATQQAIQHRPATPNNKQQQ